MDPTDHIILENVAFAYDTVPILSSVSFRIGAGDIAVIVGPNGSGKTTLLKLILGLLRPTSGSVRVLEQPPEKIRGAIGYVPQQTQHDPLFPASVADVVLMGRLGTHRGSHYTADDHEHMKRALAEVDLAGFEHRPFAALSGGQRQRVLIARALAGAPRVLLLDEPTSNVDQFTVQRLYQILRGLAPRMTVVFVSHDVGLVSSVVTSVICVSDTVVLHPVSTLTGQSLAALYGGDMALVRHDHRCAESGHTHA